MKKNRFAIVGTGRMAQTMMSTFKRADIPVVAIASRDAVRAQLFANVFGIPAGPSDLSEILRREDVDAVYIANAHGDHASTAMQALDAGKAVLCEKPIATSVRELERIIATARRNNLLCMEGLWTFLLPSHQKFIASARSASRSGSKSLIASFGYPSIDAASSATGIGGRGGVLLDRGIYLIALALRLLGPVETLTAQFSFDEAGQDTEAFLQLRHQNGGHSQLATSFLSLLPNCAHLSSEFNETVLCRPLIGSEGLAVRVATMLQLTKQDLSAMAFPSRLKARLRSLPQLRRVSRLLDRPSTQNLPFGSDQYLPQLYHFVSLLENEKKESHIVPLRFSLEVHKLIERARVETRSAVEGA